MVDLLTFIASAFYILWIFMPSVLTEYNTKFYKDLYRMVPLSPHPAVFPIVWMLLYVLMSASAVWFICASPIGVLSTNYVVALGVLLLDIALHVHWSNMFFKEKRFVIATLECMAIVGCGITYLVFTGIEGQWWAFGFFAPNVLWTSFATILCAIWAYNVHISKRGDYYVRKKRITVRPA
jgi:translocator protein